METPKKSSSPYQVLGNRTIDQWKVTELKEELKRRRLKTGGLKDDLVKRLDEAVRVERESANSAAAAAAQSNLNGNFDLQNQAANQGGLDFGTPVKVDDGNVSKTDNDWVMVDAVFSQPAFREQNVEASDVAGGKVLGRGEVHVVRKTVVETVTETVFPQTCLTSEDALNEGLNSAMENDSKSQLENEGSKNELGLQHGTEKPESQLEYESPKLEVGNEKPIPVQSMDTGLCGKYSKPKELGAGIQTSQVPTSANEDFTNNSFVSANQVSEVSTALGLEVNSDSISSDSIVEKNELKDHIIAENVKLELNVKTEMVNPSSINLAPDAGGSHPMDVEDPHEKNVNADKKDDSATYVDKSSADVEYSEKLNLDRSSGDDSMEEDAFDNKQIDTKSVSDVYDDKSEQVDVEIKAEVVVDVVSEEKVGSHVEDKGVVAAEKRKLPDQQTTENSEPVKRQRRWNSASVKVTEPQISASTISTTPKESISPAVGRPIFSRSDSTLSDDNPKERVVPPSANPPTNSLRIDQFVRPFTLKAVQELLGKTGTVVSFWMDPIKTHCYVTYSSAEEASATRNAVYNLKWPANGGRLLIADFVDPQEVKNRVEPPAQSPAAPANQQQPSPRLVQRQQQPPASNNFPLPSPKLSVPPPARDGHTLPLPPLPEKVEPPIVTLDDLFRKTTSLPRIYYLPLSEEQVAEKLAARGKDIRTT